MSAEGEPPGRAGWWIGASVGLVVLVVVAAALSSGPAGAAGPGGTLALERFLRASGRRVEGGAAPPAAGTFLLMTDLRAPRDDRSLLAWAERGGRLVVADPNSVLPGLAGVQPVGAVGGLGVTRSLGPRCVAPEAAGVRRIAVAQTDALLSPLRAAAVPCYPDGDGSFAVVVPWGRGTVVVLGGASPLTNALLASDDNAGFALDVVGAGTVVFGTPLPPQEAGGNESVWRALPVGARAAVVAAALAAVLFGIARGRRLGRPVTEAALAPIPASELVRARANLYRRSRATGHAGAILREAAAGRLERRLGMPRGSTADLEARVSERAGVSPDRARMLLAGPPPRDDEQLIALGRDLEELERSVEGRA